MESRSEPEERKVGQSLGSGKQVRARGEESRSEPEERKVGQSLRRGK